MWSFLYGKNHGQVELILDNAPARSAELLAQDRVDAALVPVICAQTIEHVKLIPDVCVGAREKVRSVRLVTDDKELSEVRSVALDVSSKTSVVLTKIIFREFLDHEPAWIEAEPDVDKMLSQADAALIIGDPALRLSTECGMRNAESDSPPLNPEFPGSDNSALHIPHSALKIFDLAELWHQHTGLGFVFAMWMTRRERCEIDFAAARDEGIAHIDEIAANYSSQIGLSNDELKNYLTENISFAIDDSMQNGMELYFKLAAQHNLIERLREIKFV